MLLNEHVSYQNYDPSFMKQNKHMSRQQGAGRKQTTMPTVVTSGR